MRGKGVCCSCAHLEADYSVRPLVGLERVNVKDEALWYIVVPNN